jgi:AcrR family transcriptional regulator
MDERQVVERRERKDARRNLERILKAAHSLFAERGSDVTMEEVARRAGVGVGTVYRRFPSKEHLFAAVSQAVCSDAHQCIAEATAAERDPVRKLYTLVLVHYRRTLQQAPLMDAYADRERRAYSEQQRLYQSLHHMLQHVIIEGQQQGTVRQGSPAILATLCLELLNPRTIQNLQHVMGGSAEEAADEIVRFMLRGLGLAAE